MIENGLLIINRNELLKTVIDHVSYRMIDDYIPEVTKVYISRDRLCDKYISIYKKQNKRAVFVEYTYYLKNCSHKTTKGITIPIGITNEARDIMITRFIDSALISGRIECKKESI